jgi:hypothetical protein
MKEYERIEEKEFGLALALKVTFYVSRNGA